VTGPTGQSVRELAGDLTLSVAGYETRICVSEAELCAIYLPLLEQLIAIRRAAGRRVLAGLAGIPGGGKSTFAAVLEHLAHKRWGSSEGLAVVGMDGWHYPDAVLNQRTLRDEAGREISLRRRKGSADSFDVQSFTDSLRLLRDATHDVLLPAYDRRTHEPVPGAVRIEGSTALVIVEGNYLFSGSARWKPVSELLSPRLFLACDKADARDRIIARHMRGGLSRAAAEEKYAYNDEPNMHEILATAGCADILIRLRPRPEMCLADSRSTPGA
jgi:pantothenate kinase